MNPISFFRYLFDEPKYYTCSVSLHYVGKSFEERFLEDHNFIKASDIFLSDIESMVYENIDCNKDKQKIQNKFEKFDDIEFNLIDRYEYNKTIIFMCEFVINRTVVDEKDRKRIIEKVPKMMSQIQEAKKNTKIDLGTSRA